LTGLGLVAAGLALCTIENTSVTPVRVLLLAVGLFTAGAAIGRRLQTAGGTWEQRLESAGMLSLGAFAGLLAYLATDEAWDSARFFLAGVMIVALVGALLVLLPVLLRKVVASLLIVFHFAGIFVAGTNVAPQGMDQAPWLTQQAWTRCYRFYLGYLYLTNAYHFYSPNPGPSTLIWFRIQYKDGSHRWVKRPSKKDTLMPLDYTRSMVIADSTNLSAESLPPALLARRIEERRLAGAAFRPDPGPNGEKYPGEVIPIMTEDKTVGYGLLPVPPDAYREPNEYAKRLISSYVRYVGKNYPSTTDPASPIDHIKVYRFTHRLIAANEMAFGRDPMQEVFLVPYFMGKFNTNGELIDKQQQYDNFGHPLYEKYDGFLYWTIPIVAIPKAPPGQIQTPWMPKEFTVLNYMRLHAGDIKSLDEPYDDDSKQEEGR
jgi:hypothetical protein